MIKTITFAMVHFTVAFSVAWILTGDVVIGGVLAMVEPAVNTVAYFFHEKVWQKISDRREKKSSEHGGAVLLS